MKIICIFIAATLFFTGCSSGTISEGNEAGVSIPFRLDLEDESPTDVLFFPQNDSSWTAEPSGIAAKDCNGGEVSENTVVMKRNGSSAVTVPAGADSDSFYLGDSSWEGYTLSFDFMLNEAEYVSFSVFDESLLTEWDYGDEEGRTQTFEFEIREDGLYFVTVFDTGSFKYKNSDGGSLIGTVDKNIWNHVDVFENDSELHIAFNGEDTGVCYEFSSAPRGRVGLGGDHGCMIKNVFIGSASVDAADFTE